MCIFELAEKLEKLERQARDRGIVAVVRGSGILRIHLDPTLFFSTFAEFETKDTEKGETHMVNINNYEVMTYVPKDKDL